MTQRRLIVLRGPAGVGKSSLAERLREALGYPAAVIDTDLFNWTMVPGESNKQVVYDHVGLLAESYLRYGYNVIVSGLILTHEECGAMAALRAKSGLLGGAYWDFFCHAPLEVVCERAAARRREVPMEWIERWWHDASADVELVPWSVRELDMLVDLEENVRRVLAAPAC